MVVGQSCGGPGDGGAAGDAAPGSAPSGTTGDAAGGSAAESPPWCTGFWGCAWAGTQQVGSGLWNVVRGAWDDVMGLVGLILHPSRLLDAAEYIWNNPWDALRQLVWDDDSAGTWDRGDFGGAIGRTLWNVGSMFIPGVNFGKAGSVLGDLGRISRAATAAAGLLDEVADLARRAQQAAARGNLYEAADLAAQAQRRADDAAADARRAGCLGAGELAGVRVLAMAGPNRAAGALVRRGGPVVLAVGCDGAAAASSDSQRLADDANVAAGIPRGFATADEFARFGTDLKDGLSRAGHDDVTPIFQGSSVTGSSFRTGEAFDAGRISDYDIALASPDLLQRAREAGIGLRSGGTRTGPLTPDDLRAMGLEGLADDLSRTAGREVNFMIYGSPDSALQRSVGIVVP